MSFVVFRFRVFLLQPNRSSDFGDVEHDDVSNYLSTHHLKKFKTKKFLFETTSTIDAKLNRLPRNRSRGLDKWFTFCIISLKSFAQA